MTSKKTAHALIGSAALAVVLLSACGDDSGNTNTPPATSGAATASATVVIKDVKFVNASVRVSRGGQVVFDNQDTQPHTATADTGSFDTDSIAAGARKPITFDKTGTFTFHCSFHPFMTGTVVVE